jgi:CheY-like chemotaxis protein
MKFRDRLDAALVVDDELLNIEWLIDYLQSLHLEVIHVENLEAALELLAVYRYRYVIIDLNIPFGPAAAERVRALGNEYIAYPGVLAAHEARNSGHNTYQVVVYSVHDSAEVRRYAEHIRFSYIIKGRPRELKAHIQESFTMRPHGWKTP